jgi:hypothetical protein
MSQSNKEEHTVDQVGMKIYNLSEVIPLCMNLYNTLLCTYIYIIYTKSQSTQQYKEQRLD